ncbi:MAG: hypothetical protein QXI37_01260 [Thermoprotei archaeon]
MGLYLRFAEDPSRSFRAHCYGRLDALEGLIGALRDVFSPVQSEIRRGGLDGEVLHARQVGAEERPSTVAGRVRTVLKDLDPGRVTSSVVIVRGKWLGSVEGYLASNNDRGSRLASGDLGAIWAEDSEQLYSRFISGEPPLFQTVCSSMRSLESDAVAFSSAYLAPRPITLGGQDSLIATCQLEYPDLLLEMFDAYRTGLPASIRASRLFPYRRRFITKCVLRAVSEDEFYRVLEAEGVKHDGRNRIVLGKTKQSLPNAYRRLCTVFDSVVKALPAATKLRMEIREKVAAAARTGAETPASN